MASKHCPICQRTVAPREANASFPFCSPRCRTLDLGRWLGEEYRIPAKQEELEDELPSDFPRDDHEHGDDA